MANLPTVFNASVIKPLTDNVCSTDGMAAAAEWLAKSRYRYIPAVIREGQWWMVSIDKVPHRVTPNGLLTSVIRADPHNSANHCSFGEALAAVSTDEKRIELMLILGAGNEFVCVDLDTLEKITDDDKEPATEYQRQIREHLACTYSEVSRSGLGMHFIGIAPQIVHEKTKAQKSRYKVDLLFRHGLVLTGDHRTGTTEIVDISSQIHTILHSMDGVRAVGATALEDINITPAHCDEARLVSILTNNKHGEAFRTGRNISPDWSSVRTAMLNTAAEFTTNEQLVYRVMLRAGFVQLAEGKGRESRLAKFERQWASEWQKALVRTEPNRRGKATSIPAVNLTLANLWDQSRYVQFMVQERAKKMVTEGLVGGDSAETLAPLFRYLKPEMLNELENEVKRFDEKFAKTCMDARILTKDDADSEVRELNTYINAVAQEEATISRKARFRQYNRQYYIVENYGGTAKVFRDEFHPLSGTQMIWSLRAFCEAKTSDKMFCGWDLEQKRPIFSPTPIVWVNSASARRYVAQEARFETSEREITVETGKILNLFQGWVTVPVEGDWSNIRFLIRNILCSGMGDASEYLLNYLAHMIQKPHRLPGTAIILQSEEQGTGKTTFMDILRKMLGARYCSTTADANTLVGQFNSSAMNKILLHFEEAVAPNDRVIESKVKALITNEMMTYNPKGIAAIEARNYARVFMTSNAQQVAHLARHDRRMFVLNVSAKHANCSKFWIAAHTAYPHELEAFMHALQKRDISDFRPSVIPYTEAKDKQKMESVVGPEHVLRDFLETGRLPACSRFDGYAWDVRVSALSNYFKEFNIKVRFNTPQPGRIFKPIALGPVGIKRLTINGEHSKTYRVVTVPSLQEARKRFLAHQHVAAHDWGDDPTGDWALD